MPNLSSFKNKEEYRKWYRRYRKNNREKLREYNRNYNREWRIENGLKKDRVRSQLNRAVKIGIVKKNNCLICGSKNSQGHHKKYSEPLNVIWLCPVHHKDFHRKIKNMI